MCRTTLASQCAVRTLASSCRVHRLSLGCIQLCGHRHPQSSSLTLFWQAIRLRKAGCRPAAMYMRGRMLHVAVTAPLATAARALCRAALMVASTKQSRMPAHSPACRLAPVIAIRLAQLILVGGHHDLRSGRLRSTLAAMLLLGLTPCYCIVAPRPAAVWSSNCSKAWRRAIGLWLEGKQPCFRLLLKGCHLSVE